MHRIRNRISHEVASEQKQDKERENAQKSLAMRKRHQAETDKRSLAQVNHPDGRWSIAPYG